MSLRALGWWFTLTAVSLTMLAAAAWWATFNLWQNKAGGAMESVILTVAATACCRVAWEFWRRAPFRIEEP